MKCLLSIILICSLLEGKAQNLVANPSFEERECLQNNENPTRFYERSLFWSDHDFNQYFSINGFCDKVPLLDTSNQRIPKPITGTTYGHMFMGFPAFTERLAHGLTKNILVLC